MQISERFRRGVIVPLDDAAARSLEDDDISNGTRVHFVEIDGQAEFELLRRTGIFEAINDATGSLIDDYEAESVSVEMVPLVRDLVQSYIKRRAGGDVGRRFFASLMDVCDLAQRTERPIYFIL